MKKFFYHISFMFQEGALMEYRISRCGDSLTESPWKMISPHSLNHFSSNQKMFGLLIFNVWNSNTLSWLLMNSLINPFIDENFSLFLLFKMLLLLEFQYFIKSSLLFTKNSLIFVKNSSFSLKNTSFLFVLYSRTSMG